MGQLKPRSGYNPPAGGGYTAETFPSSGAGARRYARPKKPVKRQAQPVKKQAQNYGSYRDLSDPLSQHILANGSPEPKPPIESVVSRAQNITDQSDMYRAIAGLSSPPSANDSQSEVRTAGGINPAGAGSADTASTDRPSYMGAAGTMADNFARTLPQPSAASRQTAPESSSTEGQFKNMPWYKDAKAHHEAVKKNIDDYGSALGTLKSTWDDIPWWTKLVMLPPVFKAGSPAAGASTAGNVLAEGGRAAAGDAAAGAGGRSFGFDLSAEDVAAANAANAAARQQAIDLSEMRSTLIHAGMPDREIEAYMRGAGFYNDPEALRQALDVVSKYGMAGLFEHSAARAAAARAGSAAGTGAGSAAGEQAASHEAIVAARNAAVAQIDPQLQAALANVRKSLANHNISPRQVLHELGSPTASDKDYYEIGRVFFEVDRATHGAGLSPAERAVADAYIKGVGARMSQDWTRVGQALTRRVDINSSREIIDSIKNGKVDANSLEYIRGLARHSDLTPESQALVDAARSAGLIP